MEKAKPKNPQVGKILCGHHTPPRLAAVMQSLARGGKLYIKCSGCGLVMPTLPEFQEYIKQNAMFNDEYRQVFTSVKAMDDGDENEEVSTAKVRAEVVPEKATPAPAAIEQETQQAEKVKVNDIDSFMEN